jgi:hypothetical protein
LETAKSSLALQFSNQNGIGKVLAGPESFLLKRNVYDFSNYQSPILRELGIGTYRLSVLKLLLQENSLGYLNDRVTS